MRSYSQKRKNKIIIGTLCGVMLLMVVGYAAFNSVLKIKGTSSISSNWNIKITQITSNVLNGSASNASEPTGVGTLTATFETDLVSPGDSMEYTITVTNSGTLNANLEKITMSNPDNEYVTFTASINGETINTGENTTFTDTTKTLNAGESKDIKVIVTFKDVTINKMEPISSNLTLTLDYVQADESTVTPGGKITTDDLIATEVTSGDGLYSDDTETGRYVYKGANPDNYIKLDNDLWRIISIEQDNTLKIMKQDSIGNLPYDPGYATSISGVTNANSMEGTRWSSTSTDYCYYNGSITSYLGCNVWGSKTTMLDSNGNSITKMPKVAGNSTTYDLPEKEAYINTYLNNTYYASLSENTKSKIINHSFNVGLLANTSGQTLSTDISQEKAYTWKGKVGLPNTTDYVRASTDASCTNAYSGNQSPYPCKNGNFMFNSAYWWTMSPRSFSNSNFAWLVSSTGGLCYHFSLYFSYGVRPVAYLSSDIQLGGSGSSSEPYTIN